MLIEYKLLNNKNITFLDDIESNLSLDEIALKSKKLYCDYVKELGKSNIFLKFFKDIFANEIFTEHDEFFQKIIIYSLTIENLNSKYTNIDCIYIHEKDIKIANYFNAIYNFNVISKISKSKNTHQAEVNAKIINQKKRIINKFQTLIDKIKISFFRRVNLIRSIRNLDYNNQVLLHHSNRFDDLVRDINFLDLGNIQILNCISNANIKKDFISSVITIIITIISILISSIAATFFKNINYPKLAKDFILYREISHLDIFTRIEASLFYVVIFMFLFKTKNVKRIFTYSHLDLISRCFMHCATITNKDICYIRNNYLYFSTELHCMNYDQFFVRSEQELSIGLESGLNNIQLLKKKRYIYPSNKINSADILYIDEANTIDTKEPELRATIYNDLLKISNNLKIRIKIRPHPTDITYHSRYPEDFSIDNQEKIENSITGHSIIIGRSSSLLLTLANSGKSVIIYDPSMSLWFIFQSRVGFFKDISFISDFNELEQLMKYNIT